MKWDENQIKVLEKSILKWEKIVAETGIDKGAENCELCNRFFLSCKGCPVKEVVGYPSCDNTPYEEWRRHHIDKHWEGKGNKILCPTCKKLARAELSFLKSVLKQGLPKKEGKDG